MRRRAAVRRLSPRIPAFRAAALSSTAPERTPRAAGCRRDTPRGAAAGFRLVQSVVQVLPKTTVPNRFCHILVRGRDDPHVRFPLPSAADGQVGVFLQHPQQHGLYFIRHRAYFIQKQRPAFGHAEVSLPVRVGSRERSLDMAEKEGRGEFFGQHAAVYGRRHLVSGLLQPVFLHLRQADVIFNDQYLLLPIIYINIPNVSSANIFQSATRQRVSTHREV